MEKNKSNTQMNDGTKIADDKVLNVWVSGCYCDGIDNEHVVNPDWYARNGTPVCGECGEDYTYSHTTIIKEPAPEEHEVIVDNQPNVPCFEYWDSGKCSILVLCPTCRKIKIKEDEAEVGTEGAMETSESNDLYRMRKLNGKIMKRGVISKDEQTMLKACFTYYYRLIKERL